MKILYHIPSLETVYAGKFIYEGYRDAFINKGHDFKTITSSDNFENVLKDFKPDIFLYSLNRYSLKSIDLNLLKKYRKEGLVSFVQIKPWKKQNNQFEGGDLENDYYLKNLIIDGTAGDIFHHWIEKDDICMEGFEKTTKKKFNTIILAANTKVYYPDIDNNYKSEICYVGSNLSDKRKFFEERFNPLFKKYNFIVSGSDWTIKDRYTGYAQKIGQFFNIGFLKNLRKIKISSDHERKLYSNSVISLNVHEEHQRKYGSDFNERTFKIIACRGFEISDNVKALRKYFEPDELIIGENKDDWFDKIDYFTKNPDKRIKIIEKGFNKVINHHTYFNRVDQIVDLYSSFINKSR